MGIVVKQNRSGAKLKRSSILRSVKEIVGRVKRGGNGFSDEGKVDFYQYLTTLIGSGVRLPEAILLYSSEPFGTKSNTIGLSLYQYLIKGFSLSEAMEKTGVFDTYEYYNVRIGEEVGKLYDVLKYLKSFFEIRVKQRRRIQGVLVYPSVVISISFGAVWFLLSYVVPLFVDVYNRFGGELPAVTKLVITVSDWVKSYFLIGIVMCSVVFFAILRVKNRKWYKKYTAKVILATPIIGELTRQLQMARFCNCMQLMLRSGLPFVRAIDLSSKMINFYPLQSTLAHIKASVINGEKIHAAFAVFEIFDKQMVTLIKVGEETKKLDEMFVRLNNNYEEQADHSITVMNTLIEPFIIVFLGVVIGFILVAMYMPLFNMGSQIVL